MELKNSIKILNILLIESNFKRDRIIDFNDPELNNHIDIDIQNKIEKSTLFVTLTIDFYSRIKTKNKIKAKIKMLGIFAFEGKTPLPVKKFGEINAPAIIFPFIREHLSSVSIKAGVKPILLPPVNFVELAKIRKEKEAQAEN